VSTLDGVRLPLTILLGALIIGGVVGINMQPRSHHQTGDACRHE
jgi:hypothetical protein